MESKDVLKHHIKVYLTNSEWKIAHTFTSRFSLNVFAANN